jgi:hypothetical protein
VAIDGAGDVPRIVPWKRICRRGVRHGADVGLDSRGGGVIDVRRREDVRFGDRGVAVGKRVQQYHARAAGAFYHGSWDAAPRLAPKLAEHYLAPEVQAVQRAVAAKLGVWLPASASVDERVEGGGRDISRLVRLLAVEEENVNSTKTAQFRRLHLISSAKYKPMKIIKLFRQFVQADKIRSVFVGLARAYETNPIFSSACTGRRNKVHIFVACSRPTKIHLISSAQIWPMEISIP